MTPRPRQKSTGRTLLPILAALFLLTGYAPFLPAAEHPSLVSAESAQCAECHDDLFAEKTTFHPPAREDCTLCHEVSVAQGTTVTLTDSDPGLCLLCHDELTASVEAEVETPHYPVTESCLDCHDPHAGAAQALLSAPLGEICGACHDPGDLAASHGGQLTEGTDCTRCHEPHGSNTPRMLAGRRQHPPFAEGSCEACHREPFGGRMRLRSRGERLCTACHGEMSESDAQSVHAALEGSKGVAGCISCHDPHMSDSTALAVAAGNELCRRCHGETVTAAEADTGHFPAADDCLSCHQPHASGHPWLLNESPGDLCAGCHDLEDRDLTGTHLQADLTSLDCTACHSPHGAGNERLLARYLHPPILDGCDLCHEGSFNELMEDGGSELCLLCHDDVGEAAAGASVPHAALELGACTDCHNPHAAAQEKLVKAPGAGPCADCHDDVLPGADEVGHGVVDLLGCRACHEPHGGEREKLLRRVGPGLCLSCHDPRAHEIQGSGETVLLLDRFEVPAGFARTMATLRLSADGQRDHPVADHRVLGSPTAEELERTKVSFTGELVCLTCHDPHKGRSQALLRWNAASSLEACAACHKQK
jgi:predicted CXXCH cytochrome family protein